MIVHVGLMLLMTFVVNEGQGYSFDKFNGSRIAAEGQFPFAVMLQSYKEGPICAGALIDKFHVLTLAKCFSNEMREKIVIVAGSGRIGSIGGSGIISPIDAVYITEQYQIRPFEDIAIIRLEKRLDFGPLVRPISMASKGLAPSASFCTHVGWGEVGEDEFSRYLRYATVELQKCSNWENGNALCALHSNDFAACLVYTPGLLICDDELWGISMDMKSCLNAKSRADYLNVALYLPWIEDILHKSNAVARSGPD